MKKGNGFDHEAPGTNVEAVRAAIGGMISAIVGDQLGDIGHELERRDRPEEALHLFERAAEAAPGDPRHWYNLGDTLLALRRYEDARKCLEKAIQLGGTGWLLRYDLGLALYHLGEVERAAALFAELKGPDEGRGRASANPFRSAALNLALCQGQLGKWREAISTMQPALGDAGNALYNVARFHLHDGNLREANRFFAVAAELRPNSEDVLHGAGVALMKLGDLRGAEAYLRRATRIPPPCAEAWYDLGICYARHRKTRARQSARRCFERVLKINPSYAWACYDLACLDALDRKRDASFRHLNRAIDLGFADRRHMLRDRDLASLRRDARWKTALSRLPS